MNFPVPKIYIQSSVRKYMNDENKSLNAVDSHRWNPKLAKVTLRDGSKETTDDRNLKSNVAALKSCHGENSQ